MRGARHHAGRQPHGATHGCGQVDAARQLGRDGVLGLVAAHLRDDGPRRQVGRGQALQMAFEVVLHLAFGLDDEAQADPVAQATGGQPDQERTAVPERIEQARTVAELAQSLLGPREVVDLLARRMRPF